ncbi:hypothetical protein HPB47_027607 [Ixodes persulcatus]|uniref:Uncharacterized protein n=1 Tax=Ixodes persulcatus TaxID=34615 RepID=A0AC60PWN6_IXOPE|nr:hypothetical protein HPB47_027607 [Ixodes persulcatus]
MVDVVQGVPLRMELDMGATVSMISHQQYKQLFASSSMKLTELRQQTYTDKMVRPCGVLQVHVEHNDQRQLFPLYVLVY